MQTSGAVPGRLASVSTVLLPMRADQPKWHGACLLGAANARC